MCYFQLLGNNLFQKKNYQNKQQRGFITTWFSLRFDPLIHRYQNDQTHFKSLSVFAAWFRRFAWPFWTLCIKVLIVTLREKCPYSEFFWSVFSHICTEYGEILRVSPYSVRIRENTDQKNSQYGHFSCSGIGNTNSCSEAYSQPGQKSRMEILAQIVSDFQPLTLFAKGPISVV